MLYHNKYQNPFKMRNLNNLTDLLVDELQELHSAERYLEKHLPETILKASNADLKKALTNYHVQTSLRIERLEETFKSFNQPVINGKCEVVESLIAKAGRLQKRSGESHVADAAEILAIQGINHYMIASYGALVAYAKATNHQSVAESLQSSLSEQRAIDRQLTLLAVQKINNEAKEKLLVTA